MAMVARRVVGNTGARILGKGAVLLVSMATFSLLTRYLGPEHYGQYSVILTVVGIVATLAEFGLGTIGIRQLAAGRAGVGVVLPAVLAIRVGLGGLGLVASAAIGLVFGYGQFQIQLIFVYSLTLLMRGAIAGSYGLLSMATLQAGKNALADLFFGPDSGPSHLASAVGTPSIVLFGPTDPATCQPRGPHVTALWHGNQDDGPFACALRPGTTANRDIPKITIEEVLEAVRRLKCSAA